MRPVSATTTIDAPRERVFDLIADLGIRGAITDHFLSEFRLSRVDPVGPGAAARFRIGDSGMWMDTTIESVERPHLVRERGLGGRSNKVGVFTVWELAPGEGPEGCEVTVTFWTEPANPFDRARELLMRKRRLRRGWRRTLQRLRELAEVGEPVERVTVAGGDRIPAFNR
jgi:uncharacterized protein YndB with AHSA1/START domain